MERKIGKLGLSPVTALGCSHSGNPGPNGGPGKYRVVRSWSVNSRYDNRRFSCESCCESRQRGEIRQTSGKGISDRRRQGEYHGGKRIRGGFIGSTVALMVRDIFYGEGMFRPLTEAERVTANLLMFSDMLPE